MAATAKRGKRANGEGSIRQRKPDLWEARFSYHDADGRIKRDSVYGKTQRETIANRAAKLREIAQRGAPITERQSVAQFLDRWLADVVKPNKAPKTYVSYELTVRRHIKPNLGHLTLSRLTEQHIQSLIAQKVAEGRLSTRSVEYIHTVLHIALEKAERWGLVPRNVAEHVDVPRPRRREAQPLTADQARHFFECVRSDQLYALYVMAAHSGLRQGELFGLRWRDIDFDNAVVQVRMQLQRVDGKPRLKEPKTPKSRRTVELSPAVVAALKAHRLRQAEQRLAAVDWEDWGLVFTTPQGTPLDPANVLKRFQRHIADAGLPHQRFHDLRHLCATLLLEQNVHMRVVQDILGHTQLATTMDIYSHVRPAQRRAALDSLDALLAAGD